MKLIFFVQTECLLLRPELFACFVSFSFIYCSKLQSRTREQSAVQTVCSGMTSCLGAWGWCLKPARWRLILSSQARAGVLTMALREPFLVWTYDTESLDEKEAVGELAAACSLSSTTDRKAHQAGAAPQKATSRPCWWIVFSVKQDTATGQEKPQPGGPPELPHTGM